MGAVPVQKTIGAGLVPVEDEILAQQAHGLGRLVVQLGYGGDGHPVAPKQLPHRGASADLRQPPVLFVAQHRFGSSISVVEEISFDSSYGWISPSRRKIEGQG
jgi:hypothetical protein